MENPIWPPAGACRHHGPWSIDSKGVLFAIVPKLSSYNLGMPQESPRFLASVGKNAEALQNLAYMRRDSTDSEDVLHEMAEIETAIQEEREARQGLGLKEAFFGKGNFIRFVIAFVIFLLQQWGGQNSVKYVDYFPFYHYTDLLLQLLCAPNLHIRE